MISFLRTLAFIYLILGVFFLQIFIQLFFLLIYNVVVVETRLQFDPSISVYFFRDFLCFTIETKYALGSNGCCDVMSLSENHLIPTSLITSFDFFGFSFSVEYIQHFSKSHPIRSDYPPSCIIQKIVNFSLRPNFTHQILTAHQKIPSRDFFSLFFHLSLFLSFHPCGILRYS